MKDKRNYGMYALAAAIVVVGALIVGAPMKAWSGSPSSRPVR
ncbi:hypothetical protein ABZ568_09575 [Streptomyces olindensis]|uniref:Uncharacterized protein n=1 Tax=Streptomyces olindensis TaxID=358823 RepID=A0ABV2XRP4_9ACTN